MFRFGLLCLIWAMPSMLNAQAVQPSAPPRSFTEAEVAAVPMPALAFEETPMIAENYEKYFYFHREDTSFSEAFADISHCDQLSNGISYRFDYGPYDYPNYDPLSGVIGWAVADAIIGSAERRRVRRINIRNCMAFKGYDRYGLKKELWEKFHFEGSTVEPKKREAFLMMQARVASGPKPATKALVK